MAVRPHLQDYGKPVSPADLEQFERRNGIVLPREYREFLLRTNGGSFPCSVQSASKKKPGLGLSVTYLYSLNSEFDYDDLQEQYTSAQKYLEIPKSMLPISDDGLGNPICISLGDPDIAPIWVWDHETGKGHQSRDSFTEFLDGIEYDEPWIETDPAFSAAEQGDVDALARMLEAGVPVEKRNGRGWTLLMCAALSSQDRAVELLLKAGADANARDPKGATILHLVTCRNSVDVVKLLVKFGADLEALDKDGATPLIRALASRRIAMAVEMIRLGANVNTRDDSGQTPLSFCHDKYSLAYRYVAPLLKERGAIE